MIALIKAAFPEETAPDTPFKEEDLIESVYFDTANPRELALPSIGSDAIVIDDVFFETITSDTASVLSRGSEHSHSVVGLSTTLFSEGSPFVADGDDLELGNTYKIYVGPEQPPCIVQGLQIETGRTHEWHEANMRYLGDEECAQIMGLLPSLSLVVDQDFGHYK
jgi:hypothetical protein